MSDDRSSTSSEFPDRSGVKSGALSDENTPWQDDLPRIEPMTLSLLGKFFGVPLLIIGTIVGGAVVVVLLFGAPSSPQQRSIDELLAALESSSGEAALGILLPREKELWQTALELTKRLEKKDAELTEEELKSVADRLTAIVRTDITQVEKVPTVGPERENQIVVRHKRIEFAIRALGRTQRPESVPPLIEIVRSGNEGYAAVAMQQLADLHELPGVRDSIAPMLAALEQSESPVTRLTACTALSVLADPGDERVIDSLATLRRSAEGEVAWSAALALARLGSAEGKSTLLDLLDRSFWETGDRYQMRDESGKLLRYRMPPARVDELLIAAIDAAANLGDADLWEMIERLTFDPSTAVRGRATAKIEARRAKGVDVTLRD